MNTSRKEVQELVEEAMLAKLEYYRREPDLDPSPHHDTVLGFLTTTLQDLRFQKKIDPFKNLQPGYGTQDPRKTFCCVDSLGGTLVYYCYWFQVGDKLYLANLEINDDFYEGNDPALLTHRPVVDEREQQSEATQ